jgi:hypothetical protein
MARIYTTQELLQILTQEREACLRGQRLKITSPATTFNPVVDPFLNVEGIQKFTAFCDFREAIHDYQRKYNVSGLIWRTCSFRGRYAESRQSQTLHYPDIDDQLIALPEDLATLALYRGSVVQFWVEVTQEMDYYLQQDKQTPHRPVSRIEIDQIAEQAEWATLHKLETLNAQELAIQLGWGNPKEALYQKNWPQSGCRFIHAVEPGDRPKSAYY